MRILIALFFLSSIGCSLSELKKVDKMDADNMLVESFWVDDQGRKQGIYQRYHENILRESAFFENDTLNGIRTLYDNLGVREIEEAYVKGRFEGSYTAYYPSGKVELQGKYEAGTMTGKWVKYYETGQVMEEVTMRENDENGPFVEYHTNGNLKAEGTYLNGDNEDGILKLYDELGELERKMMCEEGICKTIWEKKGATVDG